LDNKKGICHVKQLSLSLRFNDHFPDGFGLASIRTSPFWILFGAKDDGGGGDNWSYKTCKAPVKSSPPTPNFYRPDALPVAQPTVSKQ